MNGERNWSRRFRRGTAPLYDSSHATTEVEQLEDLTHDVSSLPPAEAIDETLKIPIPIEVPPPPNLASLPPRILHSGTVETLIGQNEDLMARLKVNLRRNATLEQQILVLESELQQTRHENSSLQDQYFIVQEKDRIYKAKNFELESQFESQKAEIELLRTKLEEITYSTQAKIKVLETYMRRVRRWARPSMDKLRARSERERLRTIELVHHIDQLRRDLAERDVDVGDLRRRIEELSHFERERERQFQQDQARLVDSYECKLRDQADLLQKLENDVRYFKERSSRLDVATREQVESENKAILYARKNSELEHRLNTDIHQFQEQAAAYRGEAKALAAALETMRAEMQHSRHERERLESENARMSDQLESLQALWAESRRDSEMLELRMEALNKINQELSRKFKEQRIQAESNSLELSSAPSAALKTESDSDQLRRLDSLLMNIESGFPMARSADAARMRTLEIIEDVPSADRTREEPIQEA